jgi:phenylacetate-CoA ligase
MSADELRELQEQKLRRIIHHAYERVPFYRERFQAAGLDPECIRTLDDLKHVPITTKQDLQSVEKNSILASGVDATSVRALHTSGSTGTPLAVYCTAWELRRRSLVEFRTLVRAGFSARDRLVSVGPRHRRAHGFHERLGLYRTEIMSSVLPAKEQLRLLQQLKPTIFWPYPTVLRALLHEAGRRLRDYIRPRLMITSGEVLNESLRAQIHEDLGLDPYCFYACIEVGRIAAECQMREGLHVNSDHLILETWRGDGPAARGEPGTVLLTGLNAWSMPLLRYRIGDRVVRLAGQCSCGSPLPLIDRPLGREDEAILLPSGRIVSPRRCNHVLREFTSILQFRMIQETVDRVTLLLVTKEPWTPKTTDDLRQKLLEQLGEPLAINIQFVDAIPEERDKFRAFMSRLPREMLQ